MKTYTINRCRTAPSLEPLVGVPAKGWGKAEVTKIDWFHKKSCDIRPLTYFRALYDSKNIYVRFDVMDTFVQVQRTKLHSSVCIDSCVEFFIEPPGCDKSYFNFEINAGGTLLLSRVVDWYRDEHGIKDFRNLSKEWCDQVEIHHSMPKTVKKPITEPIAWTVVYRIPLAIFAEHKGTGPIKPGDEWRANMYKCGGSDHWACWNPIKDPLNFHQPQYFGKIVFGK